MEYAVIAAAVTAVGLLAARLFGWTGSGPTLLAAEVPVRTFEAATGEAVRAEFGVRNVSDGPVRILGAPSTCGCTVVDTAFPLDLAAGERTTIRVEMTVGEYGPEGRFASQTRLLVDRSGRTPVLTTQAVPPSPHS